MKFSRTDALGISRLRWLIGMFPDDKMVTVLRSYWCSTLPFSHRPFHNMVAACLKSEMSDGSKPDRKGWVKFVLPSHPLPEPEWSKWDIEQYRASVWSVTRKQPIHELPGFSLRGKGWELDHFISIKQGHKLGHSPEFIGGIKNLRMVCLTQNRAKSGRAMYREHSDAEDSLHQ